MKDDGNLTFEGNFDQFILQGQGTKTVKNEMIVQKGNFINGVLQGIGE